MSGAVTLHHRPNMSYPFQRDVTVVTHIVPESGVYITRNRSNMLTIKLRR